MGELHVAAVAPAVREDGRGEGELLVLAVRRSRDEVDPDKLNSLLKPAGAHAQPGPSLQHHTPVEVLQGHGLAPSKPPHVHILLRQIVSELVQRRVGGQHEPLHTSFRHHRWAPPHGAPASALRRDPPEAQSLGDGLCTCVWRHEGVVNIATTRCRELFVQGLRPRLQKEGLAMHIGEGKSLQKEEVILRCSREVHARIPWRLLCESSGCAQRVTEVAGARGGGQGRAAEAARVDTEAEAQGSILLRRPTRQQLSQAYNAIRCAGDPLIARGAQHPGTAAIRN
mmetsp:Transcript_25121/g.83797  ORF Transcript_25121/g.83797 Transcript_25121/m.83797 type:complete len:283 (-) Transcript_25121:550-1398(-)